MSTVSINVATGVAAGATALIAVGFTYRFFNHIYNRSTKYIDDKKYIKHNVIAIVHKDESNALSSLISNEHKEYITTATHMDFIKTYEKMDKDKDIYVIIHTKGGSMSSTEAITNCILNHTGQGKIICVIPRYAYSGGCCIALACDSIIMNKNAIVGPCDAQQHVDKKHHSTASIIYATKYKVDHSEKIDETWLASSFDAEACKERQRKYMDKLVDHGKFTKDIADVVYTEFFTGKYNHDQIFPAKDLKTLGVNVDIIEGIPEFVKEFLDE